LKNINIISHEFIKLSFSPLLFFYKIVAEITSITISHHLITINSRWSHFNKLSEFQTVQFYKRSKGLSITISINQFGERSKRRKIVPVIKLISRIAQKWEVSHALFKMVITINFKLINKNVQHTTLVEFLSFTDREREIYFFYTVNIVAIFADIKLVNLVIIKLYMTWILREVDLMGETRS
jgi:hypothetical protein